LTLIFDLAADRHKSALYTGASFLKSDDATEQAQQSSTIMSNGAISMKSLSGRILALAAFLALIPPVATAESNLATGTGPLSTTAKLDFQVTIPRMLFLQVGADPATPTTDDTSVSTIDFIVASSQVGNGSVIDATPGSGSRGNGIVTARVIANDGQVTLTSLTQGALQSAAPGSTDTIPWSEIATTVNGLSNGLGQLPHPGLASGLSTVTLVPSSGKVTQLEAEWAYKYLNTKTFGAGTYGDTTSGTGSRNGRVIYTASMP